ncbi:MAG: HD-GYP domain-containing protein [Desulfurivibrionaceae bacterium]
MSQSVAKISIDELIDLVKEGTTIRTGVDIFNKEGRLLLQGDVLVDNINTLLNIKKLGVYEIFIDPENEGGLWDINDRLITRRNEKDKKNYEQKEVTPERKAPSAELNRKIEAIRETRAAATEKYDKAKKCIKETLNQIKETGGEFDFEPVADTVNDVFDFVNDNENAFSYLTREIFSYDDYLYNHSINVCTIGTVVMKNLNENFSTVVNDHLNSIDLTSLQQGEDQSKDLFSNLREDELRDISIGLFMHDIGKVLIDPEILNKKGRLTEQEFEVVKTHSTSKGVKIFEKNNLSNPYYLNISLYHHARIFPAEKRCYPDHKSSHEIPPYVKACKLADIYDAMTSKRCYKEALNPVAVVTELFHKYAEKDRLLQLILHSFIKSVGIYPPGSVVLLTDGRMAFVLESLEDPTLVPITDENSEPLKQKMEPFVLDKKTSEEKGLYINRKKPPIAPIDAYKILPDYLKKTIIS